MCQVAPVEHKNLHLPPKCNLHKFLYPVLPQEPVLIHCLSKENTDRPWILWADFSLAEAGLGGLSLASLSRGLPPGLAQLPWWPTIYQLQRKCLLWINVCCSSMIHQNFLLFSLLTVYFWGWQSSGTVSMFISFQVKENKKPVYLCQHVNHNVTCWPHHLCLFCRLLKRLIMMTIYPSITEQSQLVMAWSFHPEQMY